MTFNELPKEFEAACWGEKLLLAQKCKAYNAVIDDKN